MSVRVFVSSTCYDLLDLRAEVEVHLRDLGLSPVMSDRPKSDLEGFSDGHSIETCLTNVRSSDVFVCILSQRYGSSLKSAGLEDISATHLELQEAQHCKKNIIVYVRDRLDAEYRLWRKDKNITTQWVKDPRLLDMLEAHATLDAASTRSNWYWTFRDSPDLKTQLTSHLKSFSEKALLRSWLRAGLLPHVVVGVTLKTLDSQQRPAFRVQFSVRGAAPAFDLVVHDFDSPRKLGDCTPQHACSAMVNIASSPIPHEQTFRVQYTTEFGATLIDTFRFVYDPKGPDTGCTIELLKKNLVREFPPELG